MTTENVWNLAEQHGISSLEELTLENGGTAYIGEIDPDFLHNVWESFNKNSTETGWSLVGLDGEWLESDFLSEESHGSVQDAKVWLQSSWNEGKEYYGEQLDEEGEYPEVEDIDNEELGVGEFTSEYVLLVQTRDLFDVPNTLSWLGAVNEDLYGGDHLKILEYFENIYGCKLFGIGEDTMALATTRSLDFGERLQLAKEIYAYCPDSISDLKAFSVALAEPTSVFLWWD